MTRVGIGYDVHRLVEGRRLILGGVDIPYGKGLLGHSDADVLLHAISDALLGAAALGDIGQHFPDTDPHYAGADSGKLLAEAARLVRAAGFSIGNVDAVIVAQAPKLQPHFRRCVRTSPIGSASISAMSASRRRRRNDLGSPERAKGCPPMP